MAGMTIDIPLRPCLANGKEALFHRWADFADVKTAILQGSTPGQIWRVLAIVEYRNGTVDFVGPESLVFLDNKFEDFAWNDMVNS